MSSNTDLMVSQMQQTKEFQCPVCQKFFSRKFSLEMHLLIHKGVKPHACPFCGRCFRQKGTLMRHKALHSNTALFQCGLCNKSYRQKNVFLHHLKHTHKVSTENLDRRKCRSQQSDLPLPSYAAGIPAEAARVAVPGAPHWVCNVCSFAMEFERVSCSYHLSHHKKDYPFECFHCCILFAKRSDLNLHLMECHLEAQPDTTTSFQDLQLFYGNFQQGVYEPLARGTNPDSSTSDVTFTCIPCQLDFHSEEDFECHVKTHVQSVLCDSSDGESVKSVPSNSHAITSSCGAENLREEEPFCPDAPMDLLNTVVAGTHTVLEALSNIDDTQPSKIPKPSASSVQRLTEKTRRLHYCPFCDESLDDKRSPCGHPVGGKKVYPCGRCPKRFSSRVLCTYHLQMHLGVRPFRCVLCRRSFSRKASLLEHTRRSHTKVHPCRRCGKCFQYGVLLRSHLRRCRSPSGDRSSPIRAPVIDLDRLNCTQAKSLLGVIPLKHSGHSLGIPVVTPDQVGHLNMLLPVVGSVTLSQTNSFKRGSCF